MPHPRCFNIFLNATRVCSPYFFTKQIIYDHLDAMCNSFCQNGRGGIDVVYKSDYEYPLIALKK
jgi:hypothetical protein